MVLNRKQRKRLGLETVEILECGVYTVDDRRIDLRDQMTRAIEDTTEYTNRDSGPTFIKPDDLQTTIEVTDEGTLSAAARLADNTDLAVLNFASAKNPGGGFLGGSQAQEESLAMSSGLYPCLLGREMYDFHRPMRGGMYTPWVIYSPRVPVIRDESGELLKKPYQVSFLTSPAVNARVVLERDSSRQSEIRKQMAIRIDKVLSVAAHYQHDALILGAWGCGVFGNDSATTADLFAQALEGKFASVFKKVVFAILDRSEDRRYIDPFEKRFIELIDGAKITDP